MIELFHLSILPSLLFRLVGDAISFADLNSSGISVYFVVSPFLYRSLRNTNGVKSVPPEGNDFKQERRNYNGIIGSIERVSLPAGSGYLIEARILDEITWPHPPLPLSLV